MAEGLCEMAMGAVHWPVSYAPSCQSNAPVHTIKIKRGRALLLPTNQRTQMIKTAQALLIAGSVLTIAGLCAAGQGKAWSINAFLIGTATTAAAGLPLKLAAEGF